MAKAQCDPEGPVDMMTAQINDLMKPPQSQTKAGGDPERSGVGFAEIFKESGAGQGAAESEAPSDQDFKVEMSLEEEIDDLVDLDKLDGGMENGETGVQEAELDEQISLSGSETFVDAAPEENKSDPSLEFALGSNPTRILADPKRSSGLAAKSGEKAGSNYLGKPEVQVVDQGMTKRPSLRGEEGVPRDQRTGETAAHQTAVGAKVQVFPASMALQSAVGLQAPRSEEFERLPHSGADTNASVENTSIAAVTAAPKGQAVSIGQLAMPFQFGSAVAAGGRLQLSSVAEGRSSLGASEPLTDGALLADGRTISTERTAASPSAMVQNQSPATLAQARDIAIQLAANAQTGRFEVTLIPEELGRVRLSLTPADVGHVLVLDVERPEVLETVRRNLDFLEAAFSDAGFGQLSFSFADRDGSEREHESDESLSLTVPDIEDVQKQALTAVSVSGRLDVRL